MLAAAGAARAQGAVALPAPQNVVHLSADASAEVAQDMVGISLMLLREGSDAALVQQQLRQQLDAALAESRKAVRPGQLDVRTGAFQLQPRYNPRPNAAPVVSGWVGQAELVLEGRDLAAIGQLAGRLTGWAVQRVQPALSREAREQAEAEVSAQAIARFRQRADATARQFGFGGYSLREVTVSSGEQAPPPVMLMRQRAMAAGSVADETQPMAPGRSTVTVTVSGSVQLSPR